MFAATCLTCYVPCTTSLNSCATVAHAISADVATRRGMTAGSTSLVPCVRSTGCCARSQAHGTRRSHWRQGAEAGQRRWLPRSQAMRSRGRPPDSHCCSTSIVAQLHVVQPVEGSFLTSFGVRLTFALRESAILGQCRHLRRRSRSQHAGPSFALRSPTSLGAGLRTSNGYFQSSMGSQVLFPARETPVAPHFMGRPDPCRLLTYLPTVGNRLLSHAATPLPLQGGVSGSRLARLPIGENSRIELN
jgi:hypothetical protein